MFNWVHSNKRLMQVVLALVALPFAFWGVQSYQSAMNVANEVASVGGQKITDREYAEALRQQQERLRAMLGKNFDPAVFDSPAMRKELLEGMIAQRLLGQFAARSHLTVDDAQLQSVIASVPAFQENGKFSLQRYTAMLGAEGYSPLAFEQSLRRDLTAQQITAALSDSGLAARESARQLAQLRAQQRDVAERSVAADPRQGQVNVKPEAVRAYYDANPDRFRVPEQVNVDYVVLNADALLASEKIDANEIKVYYESNPVKFGEPEQRRASHILIAVKNGSNAAEKARVRTKAEGILAQVRKSPAGFADLAKKNSDDSGSASLGGDVGYFSRGMMVRPFEDAAFRLKPNEISDLVESDFGFHIIKVTGIKPGKMKTLEQARPAIEEELKKQRAGRRFAEAAETFSNMVYEQADSLKPAAEKFNLPIQHAENLTRKAAAVPLLDNPRLLAALFTDDVVKNHRNTEAVEVSPGTLLSARVTEFKPASQRPFDDVKDAIAGQLAREEAVSLARRRGAENLEELRKGTAPATGFAAARLVSREDPKGLSAGALSRIFRVDASKLPAYVGMESPDGYVIYRISRVIDVPTDETRERGMQSELSRARGAQEFRSFLAGLRDATKVDINAEALESKSSPN
jgi:peptidyl-prolyl cis-trans isomerase D